MSAYRMHRSLRVVRQPPPRYNPARCGQAGQLVRGPHAPPAAATFRMGTARHGTRGMGQSDRDTRGVTPEDALQMFCGDCRLSDQQTEALLSRRSRVNVGSTSTHLNTEQGGKAWEAFLSSVAFRREALQFAVQDAQLKMLHDMLARNELIISGVPAGEAWAVPRDIPAGNLGSWFLHWSIRVVRGQSSRHLHDEAVINGERVMNLSIRRAVTRADSETSGAATVAAEPAREAVDDLSQRPWRELRGREGEKEKRRRKKLVKGELKAMADASPDQPTATLSMRKAKYRIPVWMSARAFEDCQKTAWGGRVVDPSTGKQTKHREQDPYCMWKQPGRSAAVRALNAPPED